MWHLSVPWWELVLRGIAIYLALLILLRISGKRQIGQMSAFDLVLLLLLANGVQNAMNAGDNSLLGGLILAVTLVGVNVTVGWAVYKSQKVEALVEGRPEVLIHDGKIYQDVVKRERLTHQDLDFAVHRAGLSSVDQVRFAILESNGEITIQSQHIGRSKIG